MKPVKKYNKSEIEKLITKMSNLDVMKDEIKQMGEVRMNIIERLL